LTIQNADIQYIQAVIGPEDNRMATQITIRIATEVKDRFSKLARMEGKTPSQMVRELIGNYIKKRDIGAYVDDLWSRIGKKLKSRGTKQEDIGKAIKGARNSRG
jgi:predicted DNA-binding protein